MIIRKSSLTLLANNLSTIIIAMFAAFWLSACGVSSSSTVQTQIQVDNSLPDKEKDFKDADSLNQPATTIDPLTTYQGCAYPPDVIVQACIAKGGEFSKQGMLGCYTCVVGYDDAGKACQNSSDCQGVCNSVDEFVDSGTANQTGQCSIDSSPFGCYQSIEQGVAQPAICVD